MTPVRLSKNFSDLYAYSFWKVCHPVRLLQTVRLLGTLEYLPLCIGINEINQRKIIFSNKT